MDGKHDYDYDIEDNAGIPDIPSPNISLPSPPDLSQFQIQFNVHQFVYQHP